MDDKPSSRTSSGPSLKTLAWGALLLVVAVLVFAFAVSNRHTVMIHLVFWNPEVRVLTLVPGLLVFGFILGYLTKAVLGMGGKAS